MARKILIQRVPSSLITSGLMIRFPFFPTPAEGETIYSGFCRCAERSGLRQGEILRALTGQIRVTSLISALPGYLKTLASSLPAGHPWTNPECSIRLHSALPYYTYFDSPVRRNDAVRTLADNDFSLEVSLALGLGEYRCGAAPKHPVSAPSATGKTKPRLDSLTFAESTSCPGSSCAGSTVAYCRAVVGAVALIR